MITFKKIKVFISHKRTEGQASTEAILIKEALDKKKVYDSFMDVREDYIGNFPTVLQNKIKDAGLEQYLSSEYWASGADKNIPEADFDKILQIELEHTMSEKDLNWQE